MPDRETVNDLSFDRLSAGEGQDLLVESAHTKEGAVVPPSREGATGALREAASGSRHEMT